MRPSVPLLDEATEPESTPEALAPGPEPAGQPEKVAIADGNSMNVRSGPSTRNSKLFVLSKGEEVVVLESDGEWIRVSNSSGESGWVYSTLAGTSPAKLVPATRAEKKEEAEAEPEPTNVNVVKRGGVTVRSGPARRNNALFNLSGGDQVTVLGKKDGWIQVKDKKGRVGWAYSDYLSPA